ncbi:OmpL47-type beta-barrel domain-containing protein [Ruminiclostridium cellulolyticum]|uniref:Fibronectin type III domain protein n=1 Tax=Ruminiclostridium cellulolyticum (strain ATCC 35319 / DSM 5812 / JCM 6584 / H10) TaxID=394503 RepID=B8I7A5_RUMCH|nr:hypothetical protein [Ruminiclostridium cellulolyticum]ACL75029.1 Fibronectin type III domain protein [Ruminiclostridium cellulolyticum H10]
MMKKKLGSKFISLLLVVCCLNLMLLPSSVFAAANSSILPPSNLAVVPTSPDDVKVTWNSVYGANGYNIYGISEGQLKQLGTTTSTYYNFNDLPEGTYTYVVSTLSADGESGPCAPVSVDIVYPEMEPPATLTNTFQNINDITLNWSAASYAQTYNIYKISVDGEKTLLTSVTGRTYTLTNAPAGSYSFAVTAVNSLYGESPLSSPVETEVVFPVMSAPSNVTSKLQNGTDVILTWNAATYANSYKIYELIDEQEVLKATANSTTFTLTDVTAGSHTYVIHSVSSRFGESAEGARVAATLGDVLMPPPGNFSYTVNNGKDIVLNWTSVPNATNYRIYQVINGQKVLKSTVTRTTVTFTNMTAGDYTYEIHSYSTTYGESKEGSTLTVTIEGQSMLAPTNLQYSLANQNDITLTWAAAANATSYQIYQLVNGEKQLKKTVSTTSVSFTNMPEGEYHYMVTSVSSLYGESQSGSEVTFSIVFPTMKAPGNLAYKVQNVNSVVLSWSAADYANSYKVYEVVNDQKTLKTTVNGLTATIYNVSAGDHTYEVHSLSSRFGESAEGSRISLAVKQEIAAPDDLAYSIANGNDITLKWTGAEFATSYNVYQVVEGQKVLKKNVTTTSVTFTNSSAGDYDFVVTSVSNVFGESSNGSEITFSLTFPVMKAPTDLTYNIQNINNVVLTWSAVTYASSYKVYELVEGKEVLVTTVSTPTARISNVTAGDHTYVVHSVSSRFGESMEGSGVSLTLKQEMLAPTDLAYSMANGNDVTLKWTASQYATSYSIYQVVNGEKKLVKSVTTTSVTFTNIPAGDYQYVVTSVSSVFGESSSGAEIKLSVVFPTMTAPGNLAYKIQNANNVILSWDAVNYANSYKVYELTNGQKALKTTVYYATATLSNVLPGDHTYVVHSVSNRFGESLEGGQVSLNISQQMLPPANLEYTIVNGNDISLKWLAAEAANSYNIYQVIDGQKKLIKNVTTTTVTLTNMPAGEYDYIVTSVSRVFGESSEGSETTLSLVLPTMSAPDNFVQSIVNGNDIVLKWNAASYATAYNVYQINNEKKSLVKTLTGNVTTVTFTNMPSGDYSYQVYSYSTRFGESPEGSKVNFQLVWPIVEPPVLTYSLYDVNNITLSWKASSWANEYRVYELNGGDRQLLYKGTALSFKIYNLSEAVHNFEVTAYNTRFGESEPSDRITENIIFPDMQAPRATVKVLDSTTASISWSFVTYANGYNVYELVDGTPVLLIENLNNLSYVVNNLSYKDHQFYVTAYSNSFGESEPSNMVTAVLIVDIQAPVTTSNAPVNWIKQSPVVVTLSATDNMTGVAKTYYSLNDSEYIEGTTITVDKAGVNKISFYSVDKVGNKEDVKTAEVRIDKSAPVTTAKVPADWSKEDVAVTLIAEDQQSGVAKTYYSVDESEYLEGTSFTVKGDGIHKISYYSVDASGNEEEVKTTEVKIDKTAPVTTANVPADWSKEDVAVTLIAEDQQSGVARTYYSVDESEYLEGTSFTVKGDGIHKISYYSVNASGNEEEVKTTEVKIDKTAPVTTAKVPADWSKEDVTVTLTATDEQSGVAKTYYSFDESEYLEGTSFTVKGDGIHKISYYSVDASGNEEEVKTTEVRIKKSEPVITLNMSDEYSICTNLRLSYSIEKNGYEIVCEKMVVLGPNETTGKVVKNNSCIKLDKPGKYTVTVTIKDADGNTTTVEKHFEVYLPAVVIVTPCIVICNKGVLTVNVLVPGMGCKKEFDLNTATLNGVKALSDNKGYYMQAKHGQFKFDRSDFKWTFSLSNIMEFRCYVDGYLVIGRTNVIVL